MRGEGKCGERREMEGWGLGEVKGQRKKGGTFSEDGRLEKNGGEQKLPCLKGCSRAPLTPRRAAA